MKPKTVEFLYLLLWTLDNVRYPTLRNLSESYESWAYRKGLLRQVVILEKRGLVEPNATQTSGRLLRLTQAGRIHALGGRDPVERWNRHWDGVWRLILFDVPCKRNTDRARLRRRLRSRHFGRLQGSVWITPDPAQEECDRVRGIGVDAGSLVFLEARPCAGETDLDLVRSAWNFKRLRALYAAHRRLLDRFPRSPLVTRETCVRLRDWARHERESWLRVMRADPLLPRPLLPPEYPGLDAWSHRKEVLSEAGSLLSSYTPRR